MKTEINFNQTLSKSILVKSWIFTAICLFLCNETAIGQIVSGNCYRFSINNSYLDYNASMDLNYVYGRPASIDIKTNTFKVETAPAPNSSLYTIKSNDGKYLSREQTTNKIFLKANFDDPDNQVFQIKTDSDGLYIYLKNTPFGGSAMQWKNNEKAYILGSQGSLITRFIVVPCLNNGSGGNTNNVSSWPTAKIGIDNIINPNNGGVIIGTGITSAPAGYKLYVEDGILTEQLVVTPKSSINWADFVFDKNYQLKSIPALKHFIYKYKHLPDIPTSEEVTKNGINLGENAKMQLQKIEELTLYIIQHEEMIQRLSLKIKELERKKSPQTLPNHQIHN